MKVAILGTRGIPADYGGFETFAGELSRRLVERGHDVTVYCRSNRYKDNRAATWRGVRRRLLPTIPLKYTDTVVHGFLSAWHAAFCDYDVVYFVNTANGLWTLIPRLFGKPVAINVDGLEWERRKWGRLGRLWHRLGAKVCTIFAHAIVTDALVIYNYYKRTFGRKSYLIPYGAPTLPVRTRKALDRLGLEPGRYVLYVSRFEPENNPDKVVRAFEQVDTDLKLVMVGDAPYAAGFVKKVRSTRDPRIVFTGYLYGQGYLELQSNACAYIHATEVGGTHPALVEAMGMGNCVLANGTPENLEVVGDAALIFDVQRPETLAARLREVIANKDLAENLGRRASERVKRNYTWARVTDLTERMFEDLMAGCPQPGLHRMNLTEPSGDDRKPASKEGHRTSADTSTLGKIEI